MSSWDKFRVTHPDRVFFRRVVKGHSNGGILLTRKAAYDYGSSIGVVVAVGEGQITKKGVRVPMSVKPGDVIVYDVEGAVKLKTDDKGDMAFVRYIKEQYIRAVLEDYTPESVE